MTMNLGLPPQVARTEPGQAYRPQSYVYDHIPALRELLPKHRGIPGFEYLQCSVSNLRRAQDEGWIEVEGTVFYTIEGPKGAADMKLLVRGRRIPGQPYDSGARLCHCDKTIEPLTGLWINPQNHQNEAPASEPTQVSVKENPKASASKKE